MRRSRPPHHPAVTVLSRLAELDSRWFPRQDETTKYPALSISASLMLAGRIPTRRGTRLVQRHGLTRQGLEAKQKRSGRTANAGEAGSGTTSSRTSLAALQRQPPLPVGGQKSHGSCQQSVASLVMSSTPALVCPHRETDTPSYPPVPPGHSNKSGSPALRTRGGCLTDTRARSSLDGLRSVGDSPPRFSSRSAVSVSRCCLPKFGRHSNAIPRHLPMAHVGASPGF